MIEPGGVARGRASSIAADHDRPRRGGAPASLTVTPLTGAPIHVPWAVVLRPARALLGPLTLSQRVVQAVRVDRPSVVVLRAGRVLRTAEGNTVVPVLRLDVELWTDEGKRLGLLTRLRDLLPGRYAIGLTGRGPGRQGAHAGRLPAARVRLADRRRPAEQCGRSASGSGNH